MTSQAESTFRHWRKEMGFTQQQSADSLGRSLRHVKRYDQGVKEPDRAVRLAMLAISKGLSLDENAAIRADSLAA
jgi:transcriptional regulator with XRE-family HTH domain